MRCSKLHCQTVFRLKQILYKILSLRGSYPEKRRDVKRRIDPSLRAGGGQAQRDELVFLGPCSVLALAGIRRLVGEIKAIEKDDLVAATRRSAHQL